MFWRRCRGGTGTAHPRDARQPNVDGLGIDGIVLQLQPHDAHTASLPSKADVARTYLPVDASPPVSPESA